jgi:undecaprenyl-diphosphatase
MSPWQAAVLGAVQGLTEFLPVSSSAHLYVVPKLLGWTYSGVAFDAVLHWGTLLALLLVFAKDWWKLGRDLVVGTGAERAAARDAWLKIGVASVPAVIAGLLLQNTADRLRSLPLQAVMLVVFGFLLWIVDRVTPQQEDATIPRWGPAIAMGLAQAVALVPGVSRSGATITAGRATRLTRVAAARFSFLLGTPVTFGAGLLELRHLDASLSLPVLACGLVSAALVGMLAIRGLMRWVSRAGFGAFFAYRALLALVILTALARS